jgi:hypothetical protein
MREINRRFGASGIHLIDARGDDHTYADRQETSTPDLSDGRHAFNFQRRVRLREVRRAGRTEDAA